MADIIAKLSVDGEKIVTDPHPLVVRPGDTIAWTSAEGDVSVSFSNAPLEGARQFSSRKGEFTAKAQIRTDAPGGHFDCTASIGGKEAPAYGVDIQP